MLAGPLPNTGLKRVTQLGKATWMLGLLGALVWLGGCGDDYPTGAGVAPPLPRSALVSEPLAFETLAASPSSGLTMGAAPAQSSGTTTTAAPAERLVYVSLPAGAYPLGVSASIRNTAGGPVLSQTLADGGFDPIAIPAGVGDTIVIDIRDAAGLTTRVLLPVPRRRSPLVVRTHPPKGKRDVVLNSRMTIVFSEPIAPSTLTSSSVTLLRGATPVPGTLLLFPGGVVAEFVPSAPLERRTAYRLDVKDAILDLEGDALTATSIDFTSGDTSSAPVTAVSVTPSSATLEMGDVVGDTMRLTATVRTAQGAVANRVVIWSTDNPSVAVVSSTGLVTPFGPGVATIAATSEGHTGAALITVVPIPVARVAYCWGMILGDEAGSQRSEPVAVAGGIAFSTITTGGSHACGIGTGQVAYCWGANASGQLGDGSATARRAPSRVVGQP